MPASESPTLDRSSQSPAHSGGGSTPSRNSRNRPPHSAPKSRGPSLAAPRAGGGSHHRAAPPPIGQTWGSRGAQPPPHQTPGPGRNAPAFLAAAPVGNATRMTRHAGYATGCAVPARESRLPAAPRESPGEGSASVCPSLEQGLPPTLVGEIPLHRAPQALLHVHLRRPVQLSLDLAGINGVAPVVAMAMPRRWMRFIIAEWQARSEADQLLVELITEECHRALKARSQRDACPPAQLCQPTHIHLFLRGAIGFAGIPVDRLGSRWPRPPLRRARGSSDPHAFPHSGTDALLALAASAPTQTRRPHPDHPHAETHAAGCRYPSR
jgi:hypothetical protein